MSIPDRPDPDALIETDWGQWVHDALETDLPTELAAIDALLAKRAKGVVQSLTQTGPFSLATGSALGPTSAYTFEAGHWYRFDTVFPDARGSTGTPTWQAVLRVAGSPVAYRRVVLGATGGQTSWAPPPHFFQHTGSANTSIVVDRITGSGTLELAALGTSPAIGWWITDLGAL